MKLPGEYKSTEENYNDAMEEFSDEKSYSNEDLKRIMRMRNIIHHWAWMAAKMTLEKRGVKPA